MNHKLITSMLSATVMLSTGCEPDEDRCDPSLCHPPEHVVGKEPDCRCVGPDDEPGEVETWGVSASVDLTLPPGWTLTDVQLTPESVGISTETALLGPVGVKVAGADFEGTGLGQWFVTGGIVAQPWIVHGTDPVAVLRWDGPITITGTKANGDSFEHTFNVAKSAIALTSTAVSGGVELTGSTSVGPATITIDGSVLQTP